MLHAKCNTTEGRDMQFKSKIEGNIIQSEGKISNYDKVMKDT